MPVYQAPQSDAQRLDALRAIHTTSPQDRAAGKPRIDLATETAVGTQFTQFETAFLALNQKLGQRAREVSEKDLALARLQTYLRDFWEVARRRNVRMGYPVYVLNFFGLSQDGMTPKPTQETEWVTWARQAIQGDGSAETAGHLAMSNPSAAELQDVLDDYLAQADDIAPTDGVYNDAQNAIAALRPQVDVLIQEVIDQLRFNLRKEDGPGQRRVMRLYGAYFRLLPGEEPEEEMGGEAG